MRFKSLTFTLGAALTATAAALTAQVVVDPSASQNGVQPMAWPVQGPPLTTEQSRALFQGKGMRPGVYRFRSLHSGLCAVVSDTGATPPLETWDCDRDDGWQHAGYNNYWVVIPHRAGGYTVRGNNTRLRFAGQRPEGPGELTACMTVARGVLIGAPRIELRSCEAAGPDWTWAGAPDQRFMIRKSGRDTVEFRLLTGGQESLDCWALRESGRNGGTGVIQWTCNNTPDQLWQAVWMGPIAPQFEEATLRKAGWYGTPTGHFSVAKSLGVELVGGGDESFDTAADSGDYCAKRCAELDRCKGWTWTAAGYNGNAAPRCNWKTGNPQVINRGPAAQYQVISGFVR